MQKVTKFHTTTHLFFQNKKDTTNKKLITLAIKLKKNAGTSPALPLLILYRNYCNANLTGSVNFTLTGLPRW